MSLQTFSISLWIPLPNQPLEAEDISWRLRWPKIRSKRGSWPTICKTRPWLVSATSTLARYTTQTISLRFSSSMQSLLLPRFSGLRWETRSKSGSKIKVSFKASNSRRTSSWSSTRWWPLKLPRMSLPCQEQITFRSLTWLKVKQKRCRLSIHQESRLSQQQSPPSSSHLARIWRYSRSKLSGVRTNQRLSLHPSNR